MSEKDEPDDVVLEATGQTSFGIVSSWMGEVMNEPNRIFPFLITGGSIALGNDLYTRRVPVAGDVTEDEAVLRRRTHETDAGVTAYSWDGIGQLTGVDHANGPASSYTYDDMGRHSSRVRGDIEELYSYDPNGRLAGRVLTDDEEPVWNEVRSWDPDGALAAVEHTDDAKAVTTVDELFWDPTAPVPQIWHWSHDSGTDVTEHPLR